jgi:hypothetical protein
MHYLFSSPSPVPKTTEKPSKIIVAEKQEPVVNDTTPRTSLLVGIVFGCLLLRYLELVSKELNHLAAILHVYAGGLIFIK